MGVRFWATTPGSRGGPSHSWGEAYTEEWHLCGRGNQHPRPPAHHALSPLLLSGSAVSTLLRRRPAHRSRGQMLRR